MLALWRSVLPTAMRALHLLRRPYDSPRVQPFFYVKAKRSLGPDATQSSRHTSSSSSSLLSCCHFALLEHRRCIHPHARPSMLLSVGREAQRIAGDGMFEAHGRAFIAELVVILVSVQQWYCLSLFLDGREYEETGGWGGTQLTAWLHRVQEVLAF